MRIAIAIVVVAALGCGGPKDDHLATTASAETLCGDEPLNIGYGLSQMASCSFVQHVENVSRYGTLLNPTILSDQNGNVPVTLQTSCGKWLMGTDVHGLTVLIDTTSGQVQSHGTIHPGMPVSVLPQMLALPLVMQDAPILQ